MNEHLENVLIFTAFVINCYLIIKIIPLVKALRSDNLPQILAATVEKIMKTVEKKIQQPKSINRPEMLELLPLAKHFNPEVVNMLSYVICRTNKVQESKITFGMIKKVTLKQLTEYLMESEEVQIVTALLNCQEIIIE